MTLTYRRDDTLAPFLEDGHHAYRIEDDAGHAHGMVASGSTSSGARGWWAYRPMPSRVVPWTVAAFAETRKAAAERLVRGRP